MSADSVDGRRCNSQRAAALAGSKPRSLGLGDCRKKLHVGPKRPPAGAVWAAKHAGCAHGVNELGPGIAGHQLLPESFGPCKFLRGLNPAVHEFIFADGVSTRYPVLASHSDSARQGTWPERSASRQGFVAEYDLVSKAHWHLRCLNDGKMVTDELAATRPERTKLKIGILQFRFNEQRARCVSSGCLGRNAPDRGRSTRVCDRILFVRVVHLRP